MSAPAFLAVLPDAELLAALRRRDPAAMATICRRYEAHVHARVRRVVGPHGPVEEITQDVFARLWMAPERFDAGLGPLGAYLSLIARGRAIDWVRSETARRRREDVYAGMPAVRDDDDDPHSIRPAVASLPGNERNAVWLTFFLGYTYREAAVVLGIPEGTVKSRIRSGLRRIRHDLAGGIDGGDRRRRVRRGGGITTPSTAGAPATASRRAR